MLTKCLSRENLELFFRVAPKSICGPLIYGELASDRRSSGGEKKTI